MIMTETRNFCGEQLWFRKYGNFEQSNSDPFAQMYHLQLPELLTSAPMCPSTASSACTSDDSGIERTFNLSPTSPLPEDTDSDDARSLAGIELRHIITPNPIRQLPFKVVVNRHSTCCTINCVETVNLSPMGTCVAAVREDYPTAHKPAPVKTSGNKFQLLSYKQVTRLHSVLNKRIPIRSRCAKFPTVWLRLNELFRVVQDNLRNAGIPMRDIRLNGGAASYVISEESYPAYNDVDILVSVDLTSNSSSIQKVKSAVLDALIGFLPETNKNFTHGNQHCPQTQTSNEVTDEVEVLDASQSTSDLSNDVNLNESDTVEAKRLASTGICNRGPGDQQSPQLDTGLWRHHSPCSSTEYLPNQAFDTYGMVDRNHYYPIYPAHSVYCSSTSFPSLNMYMHSLNNSTASPSTNCSSDTLSLRESYVYKQFRKFSHDDDCWSLLSLGVPSSDAKVIEFKFVDRMKRQFEFTVDSFQIILDPLLSFYKTNDAENITPNYYPTVVAESVSGSYAEAFNHLQNRLIATVEPEMIRGGGLLKYCRLLVSGYKPADGVDVYTLEKYMSSRFFIDFQDLHSQKAKLEAFLANHFTLSDLDLKVDYLKTLYRVVSGSTICLMTHEHYQTLNLISEFLRYFIYHSKLMNRSCLSLEWLTKKQNLSLDRIYFGSDLFPVIARAQPYLFANCHCADTKQQNSFVHFAPSRPASPIQLSNPNEVMHPLSIQIGSADSTNYDVKN